MNKLRMMTIVTAVSELQTIEVLTYLKFSNVILKDFNVLLNRSRQFQIDREICNQLRKCIKILRYLVTHSLPLFFSYISGCDGIYLVISWQWKIVTTGDIFLWNHDASLAQISWNLHTLRRYFTRYQMSQWLRITLYERLALLLQRDACADRCLKAYMLSQYTATDQSRCFDEYAVTKFITRIHRDACRRTMTVDDKVAIAHCRKTALLSFSLRENPSWSYWCDSVRTIWGGFSLRRDKKDCTVEEIEIRSLNFIKYKAKFGFYIIIKKRIIINVFL